MKLPSLYGCSYWIHLQATSASAAPKPVETADGRFTPFVSDSTITIILENAGVRDSVVLNASGLRETLFKEITDAAAYAIPAEKMAIADSGASMRAKAYFYSLTSSRGDRAPLKSDFDVDVYFGRK